MASVYSARPRAETVRRVKAVFRAPAAFSNGPSDMAREGEARRKWQTREMPPAGTVAFHISLVSLQGEAGSPACRSRHAGDEPACNWIGAYDHDDGHRFARRSHRPIRWVTNRDNYIDVGCGKLPSKRRKPIRLALRKPGH
jgi:hypothetical protein